MRILLTGSSGWLGGALGPRLRALGHQVTGLDPVPSAETRIVGSVADRDLVMQAVRDNRIEAIIHSGALHKPDIEHYHNEDFVETNVSGTLNLLDAAVASGVRRFVFTSTTSLMISQAIRAGFTGGARKAVWLTENMSPEPRNIYGATKLSAEHLCRLYHIQHGLPAIVLRTARFFPEADDMAHAIEQSEANTKANELLFRRLTVEDAAEAHIAALEKAPQLGFDTFIVSAPTPFQRDDCEALIADAPSVVERYFPQFPVLYARKGWTMFSSIDRVYDASRARDRLGFVCKMSFADVLAALAAEEGLPG
ncbi:MULTISPECIES: NAD(P)-dependent oxidoreductase [unclassified Mesorhizobium]|uniref:NAD-dependent epimerase/dehydratase family protein n=1 Tax=unclassified Mesorhizobium TaxID=325217 RepID=UPI000FD99379|nr:MULTISPECIES: NAD(P)-dependent oxidoreductase [unclassified Mesorhizobium]TGQ39697.1 NAD(P)-dependent oxidoreductase [Mesorhizobium sp. M00.F.Ca.ET.216.01.1.1]TIS57747.1 MAG: NAD-dependent epimerase/dehydratase family protein [Mesorhizobium sp.]TIS90509.1 MAG: NAD-dependent epimerase/dehydratase family protein [Mesorhizobium sp.]TJW13265.1 MAG: NAD-dependent epimerase/dehydratase family protein [Mesorhizobium sp.]TJW46722.1 MAG: NAD-dependent epimerase/dehydratase family protein [Mesorhizob